MTSKRNISRRDFLGGVALAGAGALMTPSQALAHYKALNPKWFDTSGFYPPGLTGMRGSHAGSFEVSHGLAREGRTWPSPREPSDGIYDLVVVGGGLSGLSAAHFFRKEKGPDARILILDNHDDFGGHAKRNEFDVDGHHLIGYGGSQNLEAPSNYSKVSRQFLKDLSIDTDKFYEYYDQDFRKRYNLEGGIYFSQSKFGVDRTLPDPFKHAFAKKSGRSAKQIISEFPVDEASRSALLHMVREETDPLSELSVEEKVTALKKISYYDYLMDHVGLPKAGADILLDKFKGYWGVTWDALSALEGCRLEMPGTAGLKIPGEFLYEEDYEDEPYIFHFPDGNAGLARALVRQLIPEALPGSTMEDLVTTPVDYSKIDHKDSAVRIRLSSTAVDVRHGTGGEAVDVTYVHGNIAHLVRARHAILACDNKIIPHLCSEVSEQQTQAINIATRTPLAYVNVALRNWRAFADLGHDDLFIAKPNLIHSLEIDFPISIGNYKFSSSPDQPIVVHGTCALGAPGQGLTAREQFVLGRQKLYELDFNAFEDEVFSVMGGALKGGGFDAERDIAAITVNRWPHGYAYEYNEFYDPPDWNRKNGPHVLGRAQIGRISIANSDAEAYAYVDGAVDAAHRAVAEQVG